MSISLFLHTAKISVVCLLLTPHAVAHAAEPNSSKSPRLVALIVHSKIPRGETKDDCVSYAVVVRKAGKVIFEKQSWGSGEIWTDKDDKWILSENLAHHHVAAMGPYFIEVTTEETLDFHANSNESKQNLVPTWWITVEDENGEMIDSAHSRRKYGDEKLKEYSYLVIVKKKD